jgi:hypothetical protein
MVMSHGWRKIGLLATLTCLVVVASRAAEAKKVLILHSDYASFASGAQSKLNATGLFTQVDTLDSFSTPLLGQLTPYDAVLAYTNFAPGDSLALGNVLADYVDAGGGLVMATYSLSSTWGIAGRIMTPGYSPLLNSGTSGDVSGSLTAVIPGDPIFSGVNLGALTYFHNANFAHPLLAGGATLLATDGSGHNMIGRNGAGNMLTYNLFPGDFDGHNNEQFYKLLGNGLDNVSGGQVAQTPEPGTLALLGMGALGLTRKLRRRRESSAV